MKEVKMSKEESTGRDTVSRTHFNVAAAAVHRRRVLHLMNVSRRWGYTSNPAEVIIKIV